jgi:cell wall-associated NlpC family hydrolase
MESDQQVSPVRIVRLTASSLLGFSVVLMPAAIGSSESSEKHPASAVATRVPGPMSGRMPGPASGPTPGLTTAGGVRLSDSRAGAAIAGTRITGVPPIAKMVFDKVEAANRRAEALRLEAVSRSMPTRSPIPASQQAANMSDTSDSSDSADSADSEEDYSAHSERDGAPPPLQIPQGLDTRAATAVRAAYAQLGTPYVWGGTGRGGFDCSGLTQHVWKAAGVAIPRTVSEQARSGARVRLADIKPGDLVVYYGSQSHVGIYIGGGKIIHAPHPGASVQVGSVTDMPVSAVVRY